MSPGIILAAALVAACILIILRMRKQLGTYKHKVRRLKDHIQTLEQHARSAERLDELLTAVNEVVLRLNGGGRVIAANPCAREMLAIADGSLPQPMLQIYRDADWYTLLTQAIAILPEKTKLPEMEINGRVFEPRLAQLDNKQSLLLCIDITARHRLEMQRRNFLSNLMHDLKTPLTSLLGYARSMESFGNDPDFRQEAASVIADEAKHVNHLLDVLLTLDQIEFAKKDADAHCDAIAVIKQVCNMLQPQCSDKQLQLHCDIPDHDIHLAVLSDDIDRIVTNLLVNAIHHSPPGGNIYLQAHCEDDLCHIAIRDEGPGIPDKHLPRVTERFYRVDKARKKHVNSHGLGLSIVKELLTFNDGALCLSNRKPHGLCAAFTLPLSHEKQ